MTTSRPPYSLRVRTVAVADGTTSRSATQSASPGSPSNGRSTNSTEVLVAMQGSVPAAHLPDARGDKGATRARAPGPRPAGTPAASHPPDPGWLGRVRRWQDRAMDARAGTVALPEDLIDVDAVIAAYYDRKPDVDDPAQQVVFGTSGHRGSSLDGAFNEAHIIAITTAIVEYRRGQRFDGPLFIGRDTHALSLPAWRTALEVLAAAGVYVQIDARGSYTPTPAVSHAIL